MNLIFTAVLTAVAVALAPLIARAFGAESHTILFRIAALDLLLTGLGNIHDAMLLRDMQLACVWSHSSLATSFGVSRRS